MKDKVKKLAQFDLIDSLLEFCLVIEQPIRAHSNQCLRPPGGQTSQPLDYFGVKNVQALTADVQWTASYCATGKLMLITFRLFVIFTS